MPPAETRGGAVGAFPGLRGATGKVGPAKGVAIGDGFGCGDGTDDGTDDGNGEAEALRHLNGGGVHLSRVLALRIRRRILLRSSGLSLLGECEYVATIAAGQNHHLSSISRR